MQALLVGLRVMLPIFSFVNVRGAKFPILIRLINTPEESLPLFAFRQVEKDFDDPGAVSVEISSIPRWNDTDPSKYSSRRATLPEALVAENFRMHPNDQYVFVIRAIEDAYTPAFGKPACGAPKKIMFQFLGTRLFEAENLAPFRIDPGHNVPDGAVLAGGVQSLKISSKAYDRTRSGAVAANSNPQRAFPGVCSYRFFDLQKGFITVGHLWSLTFLPGRKRKSFELIFIFLPFAYKVYKLPLALAGSGAAWRLGMLDLI